MLLSYIVKIWGEFKKSKTVSRCYVEIVLRLYQIVFFGNQVHNPHFPAAAGGNRQFILRSSSIRRPLFLRSSYIVPISILYRGKLGIYRFPGLRRFACDNSQRSRASKIPIA